MSENEYPCDKCASKEKCERCAKYLRCYAWRLWFHRAWQAIRVFFGKECVELTRLESDLNE